MARTITIHLDDYEEERLEALIEHLSRTYKRSVTAEELLRDHIRNNVAGKLQWKHPTKAVESKDGDERGAERGVQDSEAASRPEESTE